MNSNDLRSHSSPDTRSDTEAVPRWRHLLVPFTLLGLANLVPAQRFDLWSLPPSTNTWYAAHLVTDPGTGEPMVVDFNNGSTLRWDGSAFVSAGGPGLFVSNHETMSAFSTASGMGLVYFDALGRTSVRPSGGQWSAPSTLIGSPSPRHFAAVTTSVGPTGEAFLFGGTNLTGTATPFNDLWSFDGTTWTNRTPLTTASPPRRFCAGLAHDGFGGVVLYGGTDLTGTFFNDTWRFDGVQWTRLFPDAPTSRARHMMVHDKSRFQIIVAGGSTTSILNDVWSLTFPGGIPTWRQLGSPPAWSGNNGVFCIGALDESRHELVLVDQTNGEVKLDKACSALVVASQTPPCQVMELKITNPPTEPRVAAGTTTLLLGGQATVPMFVNAAFVSAGTVAPVAPIPGSSCLNFLPATGTIFVGLGAPGPNGIYTVPFGIPPNPGFIGLNIDFQAAGVDNTTTPPTIVATHALRIVIGRT